MKENFMVCNCKQVSYADIAHVLETSNNFNDAIDAFDDVQKALRVVRLPRPPTGVQFMRFQEHRFDPCRAVRGIPEGAVQDRRVRLWGRSHGGGYAETGVYGIS